MKSVVIAGHEIEHEYPFDPTYGYDLEDLLAVEAPAEPEDFEAFWRSRYERARQHEPRARLKDNGERINGWRVLDLSYSSTDDVTIHGWALVPEEGEVRRGFVVGHGYGGRDAPDLDLPFRDAAIFFPCARGLGRSKRPDIPCDAHEHVVHGIADRDGYVIAGCVDDTWLAVSALLELYPEAAGAVGLLGESFSGGVGPLALPWDSRIARAHFGVPTFGQQPLRLKLPTVGSGAGVQAYVRRNPGVAEKTLPYFDAATAAHHVTVPTHCACALFDPAVAPPGQFAVYNALREPLRALFTRVVGHHSYGEQEAELAREWQAIDKFFAPLG